VSESDDPGTNPVLTDLMEKVDDALYKIDEGSREIALKRLRAYLLAIQGAESFDAANGAALAASLREAPRPPGFSSYPPQITKAIREAVTALEKA
jgi:hypothetical protein